MLIFICHSPEDDAGRIALEKHLTPRLRASGAELWHAGKIDAGQHQEREIERAVVRADLVIALLSADLLASETDVLTKIGELGKTLIPVVYRACDWKAVPVLRELVALPRDGGAARDRVDEACVEVCAEIERLLSTTRPPSPSGQPGAPEDVSIARLPRPEKPVVGRDRELRALDDAWCDPTVCIAVIVGVGGAGKSQLVRRWLADRAPGYGGATRVFGWSFYAQGTGPRAAGLSDEFFAKALDTFATGVPVPEDPWDRVRLLVRSIREQRALLVLDGVEPLQDPERGTLRDRPLHWLLQDLAASMVDGLCVVTTRPPFQELSGYEGVSVRRLDLPPLEPNAGVDLLRNRGVRGHDDELRAAVEEYRGHPLSLSVLGNYLCEAQEGDIRRRGRVRLLDEDVDEEKRLRRLLSSYDTILDKRRRQVLRAIGLFDRPAPADILAALRDPPIPGVSDAFAAAGEVRWNKAVAALQEAGLIARDDDGALDTHPMIRQHFAETLEQEDGVTFRIAHGRLFERFRDAAPPRPQTIEQMQPLYRAVSHACHARRWDEGFHVLHARIRQGEDHVSLKKLGAVFTDLEAFAAFFTDAWIPAPELSPEQRYWLANSTGVLLRAAGRLSEAEQLLASALHTARAEGWFSRAAESARNLASSQSAKGELAKAMTTVEDAIALADRAGELRPRLVSRDFRAHLLNRAGRLRDSRAAFEEVERIRMAEDHDGELRHYPEASFAALLVEMGEPAEACRRARRALEQTSEPSSERNSLLNIALSQRSLARALAAIGQDEEAEPLFEESIAYLRRAGRRDHLAPGLVDRARSQMLRAPDRTRSDLEEALRIATQGGFRLVEADVHLELGRLAIDTGRFDEAERSLRQARALVEETGFALREPILLLAEARLHAVRGDRHAAELALHAAQELVEAWGMLGLRVELDGTASLIHAFAADARRSTNGHADP